MTCDDHNQDLLLLAHGELGGIRRALMEQHLRRCVVCRERRQRYGALSGIIAGEIRPREMPPWSPPGSESAAVSARRLALCVALAILLGVAATAGAVWSPTGWWSFGAGSKQSQTIDTSCETNMPGNVPVNGPSSPAKQPAALPVGNHPAPVSHGSGTSADCPTLTPPTPRK